MRLLAALATVAISLVFPFEAIADVIHGCTKRDGNLRSARKVAVSIYTRYNNKMDRTRKRAGHLSRYAAKGCRDREEMEIGIECSQRADNKTVVDDILC